MSNSWRIAQKIEKEVWKSINSNNIDYLSRRAYAVISWLSFFADLTETRNVLEIGGAGIPIVSFMSTTYDKYALDPLGDFYKEKFKDFYNDVEVLTAKAEELPFSDKTLDIVIILNAIDHCDYPEKAIEEIHRCLKNDGLLFLSVDTYSVFWLFLRKVRIALIGKRRNDLLHPHHFTQIKFLKLIEELFHVLDLRVSCCDSLSEGKTGYPLNRDPITILKKDNRLYVTAKKRICSR